MSGAAPDSVPSSPVRDGAVQSDGILELPNKLLDKVLEQVSRKCHLNAQITTDI
jgi:hypothetical protein